MRKIFLCIFMLLFSIYYSQAGDRKKETTESGRLIHRRYLRQPKTSTWIYRRTESGPIQNREMPKLFKRWVTNGEKESTIIKERQNRLRTKKRVRGNDVFHKRKYFR